MGDSLDLPSERGVLRGYLAAAPGPLGVLVLHEWWGLFSGKSDIPGHCDRLAAAGHLALAVDLFRGRVAEEDGEAGRLADELDPAEVRSALDAGLAELRRRGATGLAVLGFCMGGRLALRAAFEVPGLSGAVVFYGLGDALSRDPASLRVPLLGHFARRDDFVDPRKAEALGAQLSAAGKRAGFHFYDAGHAFLNARRPEAFEPKSAALAWQRTMEFLAQL